MKEHSQPKRGTTSGGASPPAVAGVRATVRGVLLEWAAGRRHAAELIQDAAIDRGLAAADRAFVQDVVLTTLRNRTLLDHWIRSLTSGRELDLETRWLLRSGLSEILLLNVAQHAAVNENVALAGWASGLVNAVLRRACRERQSLLAEMNEMEPDIRYSHPAFLLKRWKKEHGAAAMERLAEWNQEAAPVFVRQNRLHPGAESGMSSLTGLQAAGSGFFRCELLPRKALEEGWCYAQDPSTVMAPELLEAAPGMAVLDACAAPGGKSAVLAQAMQNQGRLVACDLPGGRLRRLAENLRRLQVRCAEVHAVDWLAGKCALFPEGAFDRILLDAPCSNTGVMRRRVDVRWRLTEAEFARMVEMQQALMQRLIPLLKTGGRLVYSTCSIDAEENDRQVEWVQRKFPQLVHLQSRVLLPHLDGVDGAFAALFEKH